MCKCLAHVCFTCIAHQFTYIEKNEGLSMKGCRLLSAADPGLEGLQRRPGGRVGGWCRLTLSGAKNLDKKVSIKHWDPVARTPSCCRGTGRGARGRSPPTSGRAGPPRRPHPLATRAPPRPAAAQPHEPPPQVDCRHRWCRPQRPSPAPAAAARRGGCRRESRLAVDGQSCAAGCSGICDSLQSARRL